MIADRKPMPESNSEEAQNVKTRRIIIIVTLHFTSNTWLSR